MARQYRTELKAANAEERLMARIGLPSEFWRVLLKEFSFRVTPFKKGKLSSLGQRKWCESLLLDPPYAPLFVVSSFPTDRGALALLTWMLRHRLNQDRRVAHVDAGQPFSFGRTLTALGVHNATQEATGARCEAVRDLLVGYDTAFRVVAVASKTPEVWALNKLHLRPTAVFHMKDM